MHDDRGEQSQRGEPQRLRQRRQRQDAEVPQSKADERFDVPDQPEERRQDQESVDRVTPASRVPCRDRADHHCQQHRVEHSSGDEAGDVDERRGMGRRHREHPGV